MRPVIIVAREGAAAQTLRAALASGGFQAQHLADLSAAREEIRQQKYSMAIIALDPGDSAAAALSREVSALVPVIAVTACCTGEQCVDMLECGADDCVPQNVPERELLARIRNVMRRGMPVEEEASDSIVQALTEMRVRVDGHTWELTKGELDVLSVLVESAPTPLTAVEIAERLGARRGTVESRVKRLRSKLGRDRLVSRGWLGYEYVARPSGPRPDSPDELQR